MAESRSSQGIGEEQRPLLRIMAGRLLLLATVLAALAAGPRHASGVYGIIALAFLLTIPFALWLRRADLARRSTPNQFLLDIVVITGWIHFTGGITSDFCLLYPLVILAAGIVVSGNHAFRIALFAVLVYATLIVLEVGQVLPFPGRPPALPPPSVVIQTLMLRILFFLLFAGAVSYLADLCLFRGEELLRYRDLVKVFFNEVSFPLIAFQPGDGTVVLANDAAIRQLLGPGGGTLSGKKINDFLELPLPLDSSVE